MRRLSASFITHANYTLSYVAINRESVCIDVCNVYKFDTRAMVAWSSFKFNKTAVCIFDSHD